MCATELVQTASKIYYIEFFVAHPTFYAAACEAGNIPLYRSLPTALAQYSVLPLESVGKLTLTDLRASH